MSGTRARRAITELLVARSADKTICPSEAARRLADPPGEWRVHMAEVHEAVDALLQEGRIALSWKGEALDRRAGPYRIGTVDP